MADIPKANRIHDLASSLLHKLHHRPRASQLCLIPPPYSSDSFSTADASGPSAALASQPYTSVFPSSPSTVSASPRSPYPPPLPYTQSSSVQPPSSCPHSAPPACPPATPPCSQAPSPASPCAPAAPLPAQVSGETQGLSPPAGILARLGFRVRRGARNAGLQ